MPSSNVYSRVFATTGVVLAVAVGLWHFRGWDSRLSSSREAVSAQANPQAATGDGSASEGKKVPSAAMLVFMAPWEEGYPKLTQAQLEAYVEQEGRCAASLLTAHALSDGEAETPWLQEAADRYPENPEVSAAMLLRTGNADGLSHEWVRRMQGNDPRNSLGWYLAALAAFKEGNKEEAQHALGAAASRGRPYLYNEDLVNGVIKAYQGAGYGSLQAEILAAGRAENRHLSLLIDLAMEVGTNPDSARGSAGKDMLALGETLRKTSGRGMLLDRIAASFIEERVMTALELGDELPGSGAMAVERLEKARRLAEESLALVQRSKQLMPSLSDTEVKQFLRRMAVEGEISASGWCR